MTTEPRLIELSQEAFRDRLTPLLDVYICAMGYPPDTAQARAALWCDHSRRRGFRCVIATASDESQVLALAYGYLGRLGQWWHTEVARGLGPSGAWWLDDYFELTELHVRPESQGRGLGEATLRQLLDPVTAQRVLLSTPEGENRAWRLYRRMGFTDVLREFLFTGDARPFGVLGRPLPLESTTDSTP